MKISELGNIDGVILAGGRARRMGGDDKGRRELAGRSLMVHVIDRLRPQVSQLILNANDDPKRFADLSLPVVPDSIPDRPGPLAGILAGLDWVAAQTAADAWVLTAPADCPFLPRDLTHRLAHGLMPLSQAAVSRYRGRLQPAVGLWSVQLRDDLRVAVTQSGMRRLEDWVLFCHAAIVDFPPQDIDPFFNVNTPEDLATADALAAMDWPKA